MNRSESEDDRDPLSILGGAGARIVQRAARSLTPWMQRALRRTTSGESQDKFRPLSGAGATAQRSMDLFERVQRIANRSTVWNKRAETISAPAHAIDRFAGAIVQRFPETASKYHRQPTGGGSERRSAPATTVDATAAANREPMVSPDVPGSEAIGTDIAAATFQDIQERIQRAQRGEGGPKLPAQGLSAMPPLPTPEPFHERYSEPVRPSSFPSSMSSIPAEQVSRMPQPERMRIRRFTHIEEVTGGAAGRSSSSGPEPSRESGPPETANRKAELETERPFRAPRETGAEHDVQRTPQERADTSSKQRKPSSATGFRPLPKPAAPTPTGSAIQREQAEPRTPVPAMPTEPPAGITHNTTESVQRAVDDSMPLVSARRESPAAPVESTSSDSSEDASPLESGASTPRMQGKEPGSLPAASAPLQATLGTNMPMPVARPPLARTPARIQRARADDLDESGEDETQDDAADTVDQLEAASDESMDVDGGSAETASEESESESSDDDSDFPLRRSLIQRSPAESLRPDMADPSPHDAPETPSIQRTIDAGAVSETRRASRPPDAQETSPASKTRLPATGIQRTPAVHPDTTAARTPVSSAPGRPENPLQPPARVESPANSPSQPIVQRSADPAPRSEASAASRRLDAIKNTPSAVTITVSRDDSPAVRRAVEPSQMADTRPDVPAAGSTEQAAETSAHPTTGASVASIQRQIDQAMPLRSATQPAATEAAVSRGSAPAGEMPSIKRRVDESAADASAAPNVIRGDAHVSSSTPATPTPNVSSGLSGPVSVRRQIDQAMPLRSQAREVSSESVATESPVTGNSPSATELMVQRTVDEPAASAGTAAQSLAETNQPSGAAFRKLPPATARVPRSPADLSASKGGPTASQPSGTILQAGTVMPRHAGDELPTVQRTVTHEPMRARPRATRPAADTGSTSPESSLPATSGGDDVIGRQAARLDTGGRAGPTGSGPVSSPPLARITLDLPAIQRSIDADTTPTSQPGSATARPAGTGGTGPLAPRAFAAPPASPAIQRRAQPFEPRNDAAFHTSAQNDDGGKRFSDSSSPGVNAQIIQSMPASDNGGQGDRVSRAPAMPLVHPFGRVAPQTQPRVQREFQAGEATAPVVSFGATSNPLPVGTAQAPSVDTMTLRRMPSLASSAVIQRAPKTVTYVSPLATGDGTIQRADAKAGSVITPPTKKKDEKKDEKTDEKKEEKAEPPDLDTLAKQILPLLKRMLVVERERHIRR